VSGLEIEVQNSLMIFRNYSGQVSAGAGQNS
jgi:hypothetical protein